MFCRGIVALHGTAVDAVARAALVTVPEDWQRKRHARDGDSYHATLFTKGDQQTLEAALRDGGGVLPFWPSLLPAPCLHDRSSVPSAAAAFLDSHPGSWLWADLGEGRASAAGSESAFRVFLWPGGVALRRALGLPPQDFHVTLGFRDGDIHGKPKNMSTLPDSAPEAAALPQLARMCRQLIVEMGESGRLDDESLQELVDAAFSALRAAEAREDNAGAAVLEADARRAACLLCGRAGDMDGVLSHAGRLLELDAGDRFGREKRAFAFVKFGRHAEALPELEQLLAGLDEEEDESKRAKAELKIRNARGVCLKKLSGGGTSR